MREDTFVIRTIRNGKVKVYGVFYEPECLHHKYDGRLNGKRFAFGRYRLNYGPEYMPLLALWGSESAYHDKENREGWPGEDCVDNSFPWYFWRPIKEEE